MSLLLVQGNALQIPLADKSVHCIVTSPPYWGLRSYAGTSTWEGGDAECDHRVGSQVNQSKDAGTPRSNAILLGMRPGVDASRCKLCGATRHDAQLGSEPLHDCLGWATGNDCGSCYICHMRQVARECWRVLRDDGVMFWNIADSYNGSGGAGGDYNEGGLKDGQPRYNGRKVSSLKPKDKCGIPERTALAFQADGWYWRSDIVWAKPNPMPESVTDRPTKSHEFIYVFTKSARYFWDAEAVREENQNSGIWGAQKEHKFDDARAQGKHGNGSAFKPMSREDREKYLSAGRNLRDVWTIATHSYSGAHFATFPPELPRRCIKAATSERGCCPKCGAPWARVVDKESYSLPVEERIGRQSHNGMPPQQSGWFWKPPHKNGEEWQPTCSCYGEISLNNYLHGQVPEVKPCTVLDPFSGAATTILVARELNRHGIGLELSAEYLQQSRDRLSLTALDEWQNGKQHQLDLTGLPLFGGVEI